MRILSLNKSFPCRSEVRQTIEMHVMLCYAVPTITEYILQVLDALLRGRCVALSSDHHIKLCSHRQKANFVLFETREFSSDEYL